MRKKPGPPRKHEPVYPVLEQKIQELGGVYRFMSETGIAPRIYYFMQSGEMMNGPTMYTINKILAYTGLTYEQAFAKELPTLREKECRPA